MAAAEFVLDNSVAMYWPLPDARKPEHMRYAKKVLRAMMAGAPPLVPLLWHIEAVNVLTVAERKQGGTEAKTREFWELMGAFPIVTDSRFDRDAVAALARQYKLSAYDAAYLDVAMREGLPLASVDADLCKAARKAGVALYLGGY